MNTVQNLCLVRNEMKKISSTLVDIFSDKEKVTEQCFDRFEAVYFILPRLKKL